MRGKKPQLLVLLRALCLLWTTFSSEPVRGIGVNWGTQASHPLPPKTIVQMLKANNIQQVKLFDSNSSVLTALANSGIDVMVAIPNDLLQSMTDLAQATAWVQNNVQRYLFQGGTSIKFVAVGNEPFLTTYNGSYTNTTYPALVNVQKALDNAGVGGEIKATVPLNADILQTSDKPSGATFRSDISGVMLEIISFLSQNSCPFTINLYPFISLYDDKSFPVDYAFFGGTSSPVTDGAYTYENVFDASYDSMVVALTNAGYGSMTLIVGEIGWPTDGDISANINYSQKFNQGFIQHVLKNTGTPRRPNLAIDFYLFSLIDEDMKSIAPGNFERHWGIFQYDGKPKYPLSLSASSNGATLVAASGVQYLTTEWCVYNPDSNGDQSTLGASITYACTNSDCTSLGYGCSCNPYLDQNGNASYAFNQYFQAKSQDLGTCYFNGLAHIVTQNPSVNTCEFIIQLADFSVASCNTFKWRTALLAAIIVLIQVLL